MRKLFLTMMLSITMTFGMSATAYAAEDASINIDLSDAEEATQEAVEEAESIDIFAESDVVADTDDTYSDGGADVDQDDEDDVDEYEYDQSDADYVISPSSRPYYKSFRRYHQYNSKTKNYYTIRSYMQLFEKKKGGTLYLKSGTYYISNTIYVPSNVTILFGDNVKLVKTYSTGCSMSASDTMFQFVEPSWNSKKAKKTKHNGVHDVSFIGDATINMKSKSNSIAIVMGHNKNITIQGMTFINMAKNKHLIELNSSQNVTLKDCTFDANTRNKSGIKECVNIDSTDKKTKGFNNNWSSHDKTCCDNVTVDGCVFRDSRAGIGTHQYSVKNGSQQYHTNITITNCEFYNIGTGKSTNYGASISMLNWKNAVIEDNYFDGCKTYNIFGGGVRNPEITGNTFACSGKVKQICIKKSLKSSYYKRTYSSYSKSKITDNTNSTGSAAKFYTK